MREDKSQSATEKTTMTMGSQSKWPWAAGTSRSQQMKLQRVMRSLNERPRGKQL